MSLIISTLILPRTLTISAARLKAQSAALERLNGKQLVQLEALPPSNILYFLGVKYWQWQ